MIRNVLPIMGMALVLIFLAPFWQGCGLSPDEGKTPPPILPNWPAENPQDVIDNLIYAYNQMDYERYWPLFHEQFTFIFEPNDIGAPGVPPSGVWGYSDEITTANHMMDINFVPSNPTDKIDNMQLEVHFSGDPEPSNRQLAPKEALETFVTFDLKVETVGDVTYLVNSRPQFVFSHVDTTVAEGDTTFIWGLWLIEDAPYE